MPQHHKKPGGSHRQDGPERVGSVVVDGLRLAFEEHGPLDAPPLLLLPGLGFSRRSWRPLVIRLRSQLRCILVDLRGCGDSDRPAGDDGYGIDQQVGDVVAVLDGLELSSAFVIGHSFGGNVALALAAAAPSRVRGLVLVAPSLSPSLAAAHLQEMVDRAPDAVRGVVAAVEARGDVFDAAGHVVDAGYAAAAAAVFAPHALKKQLDESSSSLLAQAPGPTAALWGRQSALRVTGLLKDLDQRPLLAALRCPLLVIAGASDGWSSSSLPSFSASGARVVLLDGSGHHPPLEEPGAVADVVVDFVVPRPASATPPLRLGVTLTDDDSADGADGAAGVVVEDEDTGHRFAVDALAAAGLRALGNERAAVVAAVIAAAAAAPEGGAVDVDEAGPFVDQLIEHFSSLGLLREGLSPPEIESRQRRSRAAARDDDRFAAVVEALHRAYETVPFHRARFDQAGVHPRDVKTARDLRRLPVMTKADLRKNFPDGLVPAGTDVKGLLASGKLSVASTSGTSEERLQVLFDWSLGVLPERARELWGLNDDQPLSRGAVFTTPRCSGFECHLGSATKEARTRSTTLTLNSSEDVMDMPDAAVKSTVRELQEHQADVLFVNPWYAAWLALRAKALGLPLPPPSVLLSSYQHLTHAHRRLLAEAFAAPVFSYWGATDLGGALLGADCHAGSLHVREDHAYVEVVPPLDRDGDEAEDALGAVIVTTLSSPHLPLVRYEVGDIARRAPLCGCEMGTEWSAVRLEGRARDCLSTTSGAIVTTRGVDDVIGDLPLWFWRLEQQSDTRYALQAYLDDDSAGGDDGGAAGWALGQARQRLEQLFGNGSEVGVERVRRFSPERSLKFRQTLKASGSPWPKKPA